MLRFLTISIFISIAFIALSQQATISPNQAPNPPTDIELILKVHNDLRAKHHVAPLEWDPALATYAQNWTNKCLFKHSNGPHGENIGLRYASWEKAIRGWYNEVQDYDFNHPQFSDDTGHFSQVVWKSSTTLGCGAQVCENLGKHYKLFTCSYAPHGNVVSYGSPEFIKNVIKP